MTGLHNYGTIGVVDEQLLPVIFTDNNSNSCATANVKFFLNEKFFTIP